MKNTSLIERSINSALWAAYGDALGFITELANISLVETRTGQSKVTKLCKWQRKIGGRFGVMVELPSGCYSDDTQLRISTSRAIHDNGYFDVESFAKIELPVWLGYALGAGLGTKAAAANLIRRDVNWFSNFFDKKESNYFDGGGNGAAMRIQPHVWSRGKFSDDQGLILDVLRNSITTHGHPRGFLGAVFHALCLNISLKENRIPSPSDWREVVSTMAFVPNYFHKDLELKSFWLPAWQEKKNQTIESAVDDVLLELSVAIDRVGSVFSKEAYSIDEQYYELVVILGGLDPAVRGSGIVCAVLSSALAWLTRDHSPHKAMVLAANVLQSDTDTIATMAGAILGAASLDKPPERLLDQEYIEAEVLRLVCRGLPTSRTRFSYPDVASWKAPRTQSESLISIDDRLAVLGLGYGTSISELIAGVGRTNQSWQWLQLDLGQTLLVKRAIDVDKLENSDDMFGVSAMENNFIKPLDKDTSNAVRSIETSIDRGRSYEKSVKIQSNYSLFSLDDLTSEAIKSGFDKSIIGAHLLSLADSNDSVEMVIAYAAIIAKARISRNKYKEK